MAADPLLMAYLEELADRGLRFYLHLEAVEREFFPSSPGLAIDGSSREKPLNLESFRSCVVTVLQTAGRLAAACEGLTTETDRESFWQVGRTAFLCIRELHEQGLLHLPRPSGPVELRRFCRIISKHVLRRKANDLLVYTTETTSDRAYSSDPISHLKNNEFSKLVKLADDALKLAAREEQDITGTESIHMTIARINSRNPLHWPILLHEAGHKLLAEKMGIPKALRVRQPRGPFLEKATQGNPLLDQFENWLPKKAAEKIKNLSISTESWLAEAWCDVFASLVMGPAFFFSQFAAFLAEPPVPPNDRSLQRDHPPHGFRLRLTQMFLLHCYYEIAQCGPVASRMEECLAIVNRVDRSKGQELAARPDRNYSGGF